MRRPVLIGLAASLCVTALCQQQQTSKYPTARKSNQVDDYYGIKVPDPYRWLEDPDSPESRAWIEAENKGTFAFLDKIPERAAIKKRMTELWDYEKFGVPFKQHDRYFLTLHSGLQNERVLYVT